MKFFGYKPAHYDDIPEKHPMKLQLEHWFCKHLVDTKSMLHRGLMNLYLLEGAFNNSASFKESDAFAKIAFFGSRANRTHKAFVRWALKPENAKLPSLNFLMSTDCIDTEFTTPIYVSSGERVSGRFRQLSLPFGAAAGLRSGSVKRARVEEVDNESSDMVVETSGDNIDTDKAAKHVDQGSDMRVSEVSGVTRRSARIADLYCHDSLKTEKPLSGNVHDAFALSSFDFELKTPEFSDVTEDRVLRDTPEVNIDARGDFRDFDDYWYPEKHDIKELIGKLDQKKNLSFQASVVKRLQWNSWNDQLDEEAAYDKSAGTSAEEVIVSKHFARRTKVIVHMMQICASILVYISIHIYIYI